MTTGKSFCSESIDGIPPDVIRGVYPTLQGGMPFVFVLTINILYFASSGTPL